MKYLIAILFFLMSANSYPIGSEEIILSKILADTTSQLKELKEIMDLQKGTFEQIEKFNSTVQGARYRLLRTKYLVESAKSLSQSNVYNSRDVLNLMRNAKNIKSTGKDAIDDTKKWIKELSEEEKKEILIAIEDAENELISIEEQIAQRKISLYTQKEILKKSHKEHEEINEGLSNLVNINEAASAQNLDHLKASVQTTRNSALTNKVLMKNIDINSEILKETQALNQKLEQERIEKLENKKRQQDLWKIP